MIREICTAIFEIGLTSLFVFLLISLMGLVIGMVYSTWKGCK